MHATDTARGKNLNAGTMRNPDRRGHRGGAIPTPRERDRQIASAEFADVVTVGDLLELLLIESDTKLAIERRDRCRRGALIANDLFHPLRGLEVLLPRQAVRAHG